MYALIDMKHPEQGVVIFDDASEAQRFIQYMREDAAADYQFVNVDDKR